MAWTSPKTWTAEPLTSSDLNTYMRDNQLALKDPPTDHSILDEASDYTTTSTSFVNIDATDLSLTIETSGGDVMVHFHGSCNVSAGRFLLNFTVDGVAHAANDGITAGTSQTVMTFTRLVQGLSAGSHTFNLQWKATTGTLTLYAGAGTSGLDVHPQFWVREVS